MPHHYKHVYGGIILFIVIRVGMSLRSLTPDHSLTAYVREIVLCDRVQMWFRSMYIYIRVPGTRYIHSHCCFRSHMVTASIIRLQGTIKNCLTSRRQASCTTSTSSSTASCRRNISVCTYATPFLLHTCRNSYKCNFVFFCFRTRAFPFFAANSTAAVPKWFVCLLVACTDAYIRISEFPPSLLARDRAHVTGT